jgi:hypothetical protein
MVFNADDELIADGWMEFIHEDDMFIAYWEFLDKYENDQEIRLKNECGIPLHIYEEIPDQFKEKYKEHTIRVLINETIPL